jgi:DNA-binding winged helix-turn-helix (wHTH) protein
MPVPPMRFGEFVLDAGNRTLLREGVPQSLNARYFDALVLLVCEHGRLVRKQRFFDEVWAGSVVTDAALTQCIKEVRRVLGDDAADPRFVRTVAGHGYSFIAAVEPVAGTDGPGRDLPPAVAAAPATQVSSHATLPVAPEPMGVGGTVRGEALPAWLGDILAATGGGVAAGFLGGLLYGTTLAFSPQAQGLGTLSVVLVLLALSMLVGMLGAFGVGSGLVLAQRLVPAPGAAMLGAALGGLGVGGVVKLLGSDTFTLLVGQAPSGITGGLEGAAIGLALAFGLQFAGAGNGLQRRRGVLWAALCTGLAGALLPLLGGSMMASSLARVAAAFDGSRIDMAPLGRLFGEPQFGVAAQAALGAVEGAVFGGCVAAALLLTRERRRATSLGGRPE